MSTKRIQKILPTPAPHMVGDGFRVHNFFPSGYHLGEKRMSPFFLLDYNSRIDFPPSETPRGVGVHPHRGFETVTIAYHGRIAHHDSYGNSGIIGEGDIQWMTAASGVLHKEYHESEYSKKGGPFQMVQLWVNLPARDKMSAPKYQTLVHDQLSTFKLPDGKGVIEVIAGSYNGVNGTASTFTPIEIYNARIKKGGRFSLSLPEEYNTGVLIIEGSTKVNQVTDVAADHFVLFENKGEEITLEATEDSIFLILSGEPIDEPIFAYGPFLMNTQQEVRQAYEDFGQGKFGYLED